MESVWSQFGVGLESVWSWLGLGSDLGLIQFEFNFVLIGFRFSLDYVFSGSVNPIEILILHWVGFGFGLDSLWV